MWLISISRTSACKRNNGISGVNQLSIPAPSEVNRFSTRVVKTSTVTGGHAECSNRVEVLHLSGRHLGYRRLELHGVGVTTR